MIGTAPSIFFESLTVNGSCIFRGVSRPVDSFFPGSVGLLVIHPSPFSFPPFSGETRSEVLTGRTSFSVFLSTIPSRFIFPIGVFIPQWFQVGPGNLWSPLSLEYVDTPSCSSRCVRPDDDRRFVLVSAFFSFFCSGSLSEEPMRSLHCLRLCLQFFSFSDSSSFRHSPSSLIWTLHAKFVRSIIPISYSEAYTPPTAFATPF